MPDIKARSKRVIDFHSHVLPNIDDGSSSLSMSKEILEETRRQKVKKMVASPHFYPDRMALDVFLSKREKAAKELLSIFDEESCPFVFLGAEVAYYDGIGDSPLLDHLTIVGTNTVMVEMPFNKWSGKEVSEIVNISLGGRFNVLLAHTERYLSMQSEGVLERLLSAGVYFQSNAEHFLNNETQKRALEMLKNRMIHVLGSDTHNTTTRPQTIGKAKEIIKEKLGEDVISEMLYTSKILLEGAVSIDQM